jgi:predicted CoA-binding protein
MTLDSANPNRDNGVETVIRRVLIGTRTIAVVGLSPRPERPSHVVASYLQAHGYRLFPVNPTATAILGERCYPDVLSIGEPVHMVNVFRIPDECPKVAEQAVAAGAQSLWLQLGIASVEASQIAAAGGLEVVMDRCIMIEHGRLAGALD